MIVRPIEAREAVEFVRTWHYSRTAIPGLARHGWYLDDRLVGVSIYDNGVHATRQGVFGPEHYRRVVHHHRLALHPHVQREGANSASQFVGASLRALHRERPDLWAVVTYADTCQGHDGTVYRATNAVFTGVKARGNLKFLTPDGELRSTQSLSGDWPTRRATAASLGWAEVRCRGKNRYVYLLGTATQQRHRPPMLWPRLPYDQVLTPC